MSFVSSSLVIILKHGICKILEGVGTLQKLAGRHDESVQTYRQAMEERVRIFDEMEASELNVRSFNPEYFVKFRAGMSVVARLIPEGSCDSRVRRLRILTGAMRLEGDWVDAVRFEANLSQGFYALGEAYTRGGDYELAWSNFCLAIECLQDQTFERWMRLAEVCQAAFRPEFYPRHVLTITRWMHAFKRDSKIVFGDKTELPWRAINLCAAMDTLWDEITELERRRLTRSTV